MNEQSAVKQALVTIRKLQARLDEEQRAKSEPIAVTGIGCRLPGGVTSPEAFWRLLDGGVDAITEVPADRWEGGTVRWGGFLADVDGFDAAFFGIAPREAEAMDPQQRLLLEVAWEALERAGQVPDRLVDSRTGVFIGVAVNDYDRLSTGARDMYTMTGNGHAFPAGRLSYVLGLQGPSMAVDTACSSSLVAVHLACQSLRAGESTMALAGGVNLMLSPDMTDMLAGSGALSPDGRCKTFDARANGYVRGEGCGVLVLKRLSDALADGDPVLAVVRGSAVNSDGRSSGLTAPNASAQQALLRQALRNARAEAADIGYVETHGTGTPLGDPIEVDALTAVLGAPRPGGALCVLGAVKTHLGHLEAAAGVAGIIKAVLALRHQRIPANLHLRTMNPRLDLAGTALALPAGPVPWPRSDRPRLAGVSSFGISGTNAHVILAEAPAGDATADGSCAAGDASAPHGPALVPVSARSRPGLRQLVDAYQEVLAEGRADLADVAYTAAVRRRHHEHRGVFVLAGQGAPRLVTGSAAKQPRVVFVFPGQGSQWLGMGRELYAHEPAFRAAVVACDQAVRAETGWSLVDELHTDEAGARLDRVDVVQPLLFAMQVGLAALWRAMGIQPDTVVGHSMGEVAAAHVAGALSLTDAARIICRRSRLLRRLSGLGAMMLVELPLADAERAVAPFAGRVSVAASNSTRSTVLSGEPGALAEVEAELTAADVLCRRVKVEAAAHSPQVDALTDDLLRDLNGLTPGPTAVRMISTVLARPCEGTELDASYWVRNLRDPVLFSQALSALMASEGTVFVELSPHPVLLPCIEEEKGAVFPSARRGQERAVFQESVAGLYVRGCPVDWPALHPGGGRCVELPTYPWQRERYWVDTSSAAPSPGGGHPLLGGPVSPASLPGIRVRERELSLPYLADHRIEGAAVLPAAAYVEMALGASAPGPAELPVVLTDVTFDQMAMLGEDGSGIVQLVEDGGGFEVFGRRTTAEPWTRCAAGSLGTADAPPAGAPAEAAAPPAEAPAEAPVAIRRRCPLKVEAAEHYAWYARCGIHYGPAFRGVAQVWLGDGERLARVSLPAAAPAASYVCHPALLDSCFQVVGGLLCGEDPPAPVVPVGIRRLRVLRRPGGRVWVHARRGPTRDSADLRVLDDEGRLLVEVQGFAVRRLAGAAPPAADWLYELEWRAAPPLAHPAAGRAAGRRWLVLADRSGVGEALASRLEQRAERCVVVAAGEIDPADDQAWDDLLHRALGGGTALAGVVHLGSLDTTAAERTTAQTLMADQRVTSLSTIGLVRAISRRRWRDHPRLWLVTAGAQDVGGEPIAVSQAPLWGLARTLGMEHPELGCTRVDLAAVWAPGRSARELLPELLAPDGEDEIALRPGGRYAARLVRSSFDATREQAAAGRGGAAWDGTVSDEGTYLITGGLGGLGLGLARWLAGRGARHLVLVGRHGPSPQAERSLAEIRATGAQVVAAAADVTRRTDLARVLADIDTGMPPLRGVVHAAMVLDDRTILELDAERFDRVMAPKVRGAWLLHELTWDRPLDFFVLYSSAAVLLGSPGQANYTAANAFLGALARHRRALGATALCVDWGLFAQAGIMAGRTAEGQRLAHRGVGTLTPDEGTEILGRLLPGPARHVAALRLNLRQWLEFYPAAAGASLLTELRGQEWATAADPSSGSDLGDRLLSATPRQRSRLVEDVVAEQLGQVLRLEAGQIDRTTAFMNMGGDSVMALELRNRLEAALGVRLSVTVLFASPTVTALAEELLDKLGLAQPTEEIPGAPETGAPDTDELLALIDAAVGRTEGGDQR